MADIGISWKDSDVSFIDTDVVWYDWVYTYVLPTILELESVVVEALPFKVSVDSLTFEISVERLPFKILS